VVLIIAAASADDSDAQRVLTAIAITSLLWTALFGAVVLLIARVASLLVSIADDVRAVAAWTVDRATSDDDGDDGTL
jgi:hypothetical protein